MAELLPLPEGIVLAHFIVATMSSAPGASNRGTRRQGGLLRPRRADQCRTVQQVGHHHGGGGPTDDKPAVTLEAPRDPDRVSSFFNIRVKDIEAVYGDWSARGAQFLTPPKLHQYEIRCYIRDPDGHLDRGGANHRPKGGLVARSLAIEHARRGARVNAEIICEIPHWNPQQHFRQGP
jgi:hypothetical protein